MKSTMIDYENLQNSFPISETIHRTTLSLPISYFHTPEGIYQVIEVMNKF